MADLKISALDPAGVLDGTEVIPVVKGGLNKRTTVNDILARDTDPVASVNTFTGAVVLTQDNVGDGTTYKQYSGTDKTKLAGIATGATANSSDATLLARANHTGTQAESTITNLVTDLAAKEPTITATTSADYYRGDKTFQTLNKAAVGLSNVTNNAQYFPGGTDVAITDGGTGVSTLPSGLLKGAGTGAITAGVAGTDYQAPITLTTTGTSGAATFIGNTLNIPNYATGGSSTLVFNVKDYGAVGNGTTNDTTAVQAAITAAEAAKGTVYFPEGTYHVVMPTVSTGNITICGAGPGSKILLATAALQAAGLTNGIWLDGVVNVIIRDLCIDGNFANIAKDGSYHASSTLWDPVRTEYGATSVKNYVMNTTGGSIDSSTYLHQRLPIRITDSDTVLVQNCVIQNSVSAGILADGTSVNSCKNIIMTDNRISMTWDNGIYFHQGVQYALASNNIISDTTYNGISTVYCDHIVMVGNNIRKAGPSDSDSGGIQINGSSNCVAANNLIDLCQFYGIDLLSTQETNITGGASGNSVWANNNVITGNTVTNCRANDYPAHNAPGINIFGGDNTSIANNTVTGNDFGISLGSRATNVSVLSNTVSKNASIGVNIGNNADLVNLYIKGNTITYNGSHGVFNYAPMRFEQNTVVGNNGHGVSIAEPPTGLQGKIDYLIGNTILDNTDSGILTNGQGASVAIIERNTFGNSGGVMYYDGVITSGSPTLTSASAAFVSSDKDLPVFLINQGPNDTLTTTTISAYTNSTTVTLANNAAATQTGVQFLVGRGIFFYSGSSSGTTLTAPSGTFRSSDAGKLVTIYSTDPNPTLIYQGTISSYTSSTTVTMSGTVGTYASLKFFVNRSQGQQARAVNNFNDYPVIMRENTVIGIPEYLGGGGTQNKITWQKENVRDPVQAQEVATKNYVDTNFDSLTGNQTISGIKTFSNGAKFTAMAPPTYAAGLMFYDNVNESLSFYNNDANVTLNIGQESWIKVTNTSGSTIANGVPVYINGQSSGVPTIALAAATSTTLANVAGVTTESIANGASGYITTEGLVRNFNTSAFTAGALLYLSATAGAYTTTAPVAGNFSTVIGYVLTSNASTGTIVVTRNSAPTFIPQAATTDIGTVLSAQGLRTAGTAYPITTSGTVQTTGTLSNNNTVNFSGATNMSGAVAMTAGVRYNSAAQTGTVTLTTASVPYQLANATTAGFTITLPTTTTAGYVFTIKKTDATANVVTIKAGAAGTIDAANTYLLSTQYKYVKLISTTTSDGWLVVGNN